MFSLQEITKNKKNLNTTYGNQTFDDGKFNLATAVFISSHCFCASDKNEESVIVIVVTMIAGLKLFNLSFFGVFKSVLS